VFELVERLWIYLPAHPLAFVVFLLVTGIIVFGAEWVAERLGL
jgi:hypothetical protein